MKRGNSIMNRKNMVRYMADARWIADYLHTHGYAPTYLEIAASWGLCISSVNRRMKNLSRLGLVAFVICRPQSVRVFIPDKSGRRRAYFELEYTQRKYEIKTTRLRFICDG